MYKLTIISSFMLLFHSAAMAQQIWYVNPALPTGQTGLSWNEAFNNLQLALAAAQAGDEIWVAKGVCFPTETGDRTASFIMKEGVGLYGGFDGTETTLSARNWQQNETILSGAINAATIFDNSWHVLQAIGLDSTAILDGFIVTSGYATNAGDTGHGGGLLIYPSSTLLNISPVIRNCTFMSNTAAVGGAIGCYTDGWQQNRINPIITNCKFINNVATIFGGAIAKFGSANPDQVFKIENCTFDKNKVNGGDGGAIFISGAIYGHQIKNCTFNENRITPFGFGGAIYYSTLQISGQQGDLTIDSCSFTLNTSAESGAMYIAYGTSDVLPSPFKCVISNTHFDKNTAFNGRGSSLFFNAYDKNGDVEVTLSNCVFSKNQSSSDTLNYFIFGSDSKSVFKVSGCQFVENTQLSMPTTPAYSLVYELLDKNGTLDVLIENSLFYKNSGAVSAIGPSAGCKLKTVINNCTFANNSNYILNKSYYDNFEGTEFFIDTYVNNCILWEPSADLYDMFGDNNESINQVGGYHVQNSLLSLPASTVAANSIFEQNIITDTNPEFVNPAMDDYRLTVCSPAVNAGSNLVPDTTGLVIDLDGLPRIYAQTVDLGAFEVQDTCPVSSVSDHNSLHDILITPNPVGGGAFLRIQLPENHRHTNITWSILDVSGKRVKTGQSAATTFELAAPEKTGWYLLEIKTTHHRWLQKCMVLQP